LGFSLRREKQSHGIMFSKLTKTIYKSMLGSFISAAKRPPSTIPAVVTIADFSRCLVEKEEEEEEEKKKWKSFSDADFGGRSRATLTTKKLKRNENNVDDVGGYGSVVFEGNLDSSVPQLRDEKMREIRSLKRSGFAGFGWNDVKARLKKTSRERKDDEREEQEQEQEEDVDLEYFSHVRFTMRNYDGRAYVCSIKTERDAFGNGEHDLWQAFLLAPKTTTSEESSSGRTNWTELTVPLDQFMKTYKGGVVESQTIGGKDSLRRRGNMRSIGIACGGLEFGKGDMDGAFRLEVKKIELLDEERAGAL
jgi:hypothetical protein